MTTKVTLVFEDDAVEPLTMSLPCDYDLNRTRTLLDALVRGKWTAVISEPGPDNIVAYEKPRTNT